MSDTVSNGGTNVNKMSSGKRQDEFLFYLEKVYVLPLEIKNDLIYCQRALQNFLKVHSLVTDVFNEQADADPIQMQRIRNELEEEICQINAEQSIVVMRLDDHLEAFYKKLREKRIPISPELGQAYVSSLIVDLISDNNYVVYPHLVSLRDNQEMLIRKHFLLSQDESNAEPLKLSELGQDYPLMLCSPLAVSMPTETVPSETQSESVVDSTDNLVDGINSMELSGSGSGVGDPDNCNYLKKVAITESGPIEEEPCEKKPCVDLTEEGSNRSDLLPSHMTENVKQSALSESRNNLHQALRRARKTKQQPRKIDFDDDDDTMELPSNESDKATEQQKQHNNAVAKNKSKKPLEAAVSAAAVPLAIKKPRAQTPPMKQNKTRGTFGTGRKPKTPPPPLASTPVQNAAVPKAAKGRSSAGGSAGGSSGSSDDSHQELELEQRRRCASAAQWGNEPRETRTLSSEYSQTEFLAMFDLHPPDIIKKLSQRHSKRKRRTVQNASGVDFHYGQQLPAIDSVRQKKPKAKPEFLLSPKVKRLKDKKNRKAAAAAANRKSKTPEKIESTEPAKCKQCRKRIDSSVICQTCKGPFHAECTREYLEKMSPMRHQTTFNAGRRCVNCIRNTSVTDFSQSVA